MIMKTKYKCSERDLRDLYLKPGGGCLKHISDKKDLLYLKGRETFPAIYVPTVVGGNAGVTSRWRSLTGEVGLLIWFQVITL